MQPHGKPQKSHLSMMCSAEVLTPFPTPSAPQQRKSTLASIDWLPKSVMTNGMGSTWCDSGDVQGPAVNTKGTKSKSNRFPLIVSFTVLTQNFSLQLTVFSFVATKQYATHIYTSL